MSQVPSYIRTITTPRDEALRNGIKTMVFGPSGTGKTRLIATAPKPVLLSAENGTLSLRNEPGIAKLPEIKTIDEFKNQKRWLLESRESQQFYTCCIDSLSEIAQACLFNEKSKSRDGRAAYGTMNDEIIQIVNELRSSQRTIYIIAQEEFEKDDQSGLFVRRPNFPGRTLVTDMPYKFDLLLHLDRYNDGNGGTFGALLCHSSPTIHVKDRSGVLERWEEPNLEKIYRKILGV